MSEDAVRDVNDIWMTFGWNWKPIDSAPHGVEVLLYCPERGIANPERIELGCASFGAHHLSRSYHSWATHWMPLPPPPVSS